MLPEPSDSLFPADFAIQKTLDFLADLLPGEPQRILEVGCGDGALARGLIARGHDVVGVDRSKKAVAKARAAGFKATLGDFLELDAEPFEVVLFTRSLHHMHELGAALDRASSLLVPGGLLIAQEFALERMDSDTAAWLFDLWAILGAGGLLSGHLGHGGGPLKPDPLEAWREAHAHDPPLHAGRAMLAAVRRRFDSVTAERTEYLYRYFCDRLPETPQGLGVARAVQDTEVRLASQRRLAAVGLWLTARRR